MTKYSLYQVIMRLIGPIEPIGDPSTDQCRYNSLNRLLLTMEQLIIDIDELATKHKGSQIDSIRTIGHRCDQFLTSLNIQE